MHRYRAWWLTAAVAAAAGAADGRAADPPPRAARPVPSTVYDKFFGKDRAKAASPDPSKAAPGLPPEVLSAALRDEQEALTRRMDVCLKLRAIADAQQNENLHRQVDDLERQALALFHARSAALGVARPRPADALDRQLGTGVAVTPLTAPAPPTPAGPATAAARDIREVRP